MVDADMAQRFREVLTAAGNVGRHTTTSSEALFGSDCGAWYYVVVRAGREVPLVAWLLDEGLALPDREGMVVPVWCTEAAARAFARQLLVRAAAAGQYLGGAVTRPGQHPGDAYVRRVYGDQMVAEMRSPCS